MKNRPPRLLAAARHAALLATLLAAAPSLLAGTNTWTLGIQGASGSAPFAQNIGSLAINPLTPNVLYATSGGKIYKSTNGGNNWVESAVVVDGVTINTVTVNPSVPDYVYVGLSSFGVARSPNGSGATGLTGSGQSWRLQNGSAPYLATNELICAGGGYCTASHAAPFNAGTPGTAPYNIPSGAVSTMVFSKNSSQVGFAAYKGLGIYQTDNALDTGVCPVVDPDSTVTPDVNLPSECSAYNIGEPDVWPLSYRVNWGTGGATLAAGPDLALTDVAAGQTVNALVMRETGGASHIYAGMAGAGIRVRSGLFTVAGTWNATACGVGGDGTSSVCNVQALALNSAQDELWAGTLNNGLWKGTGINAGTGVTTTWTQMNTVAATHACYSALQNVRAIAFAEYFDPTAGATKTRMYVGSFGHGICFTEDGATTWSALNTGLSTGSGSLQGLYVTSLAVDPLNPVRVYAGTYAGVYSIQIVPGSNTGGLTITGSTSYTSGTKTLAFATQAVNQASTQILTLTNISPVAINFSSISSSSGAFTSTNTCGTALPAGASCQMFITFTPTVASTYNASMTVNSDSIEGPITLNLTGTGTGSTGAGTLTVSPASLSFGSVGIGSTGVQAITLSATVQTVNISAVTVPNGFTVDNGCGSLLPVGRSCTLLVTFKPTVLSTYSGNVIVASDAASSPHSVPVSGTGATATVSTSGGTLTITPASTLAFGTLAVGMTSVMTVELAAAGQAVNLSSVTVPTGFSLINSCGSLLPAGAKCSLQLTFAPAVTGSYSGNLIVVSDAIGSPHARALSGAGLGTASGATLTVSPSSLSFDTVAVGSKASKVLTLTASAGTVTMSSITVPTGFSTVNSCGTVLPSGASCSITVLFEPGYATAYLGNLIILSDAAGSPHYRSLSGTGSAASTTGSTTSTVTRPILQLDAAQHDFGRVASGGSATKSFSVRNVGNSALSFALAAPAAGSGFALVPGGCTTTTTIAAGGSCTLTLIFSPTSTVAYNGSVQFSGTGTYNATITLKGQGTAAGGSGTLSSSTTLLDFGVVPAGSLSSRTLTLTAAGAAVQVSTPQVLTSGFNAAHDCGATLAAGASCTVTVTFAPGSSGTSQGALLISSSSTNASQMILLAGSGGSAAATGTTSNTLAAAVAGDSSALTLTAQYRFPESVIGTSGSYFLYGTYAGNTYAFNGDAWVLVPSGAQPPPFRTGIYAPLDLPIANAADVRTLAGAQFYIGYGSNFAELGGSGRSVLIHTVR